MNKFRWLWNNMIRPTAFPPEAGGAQLQALVYAIVFAAIISCGDHRFKKVHAQPATYAVGFHNKSDRVVVYLLNRLDRPQTSPLRQVVIVTMDTLQPLAKHVIMMEAGKYYIRWLNEESTVVLGGQRFTHFTDTTFVFE